MLPLRLCHILQKKQNGLPQWLSNSGDTGDKGLIPGSGRDPGGGHGNALQYSCLVNPMDRGAWWTTSPWGHKRIGHNSSDWAHNTLQKSG